MNGFRLDRRADALRGGSQTVIGPGNAEGSRLYHRLVDTTVGARMPPTGPLQLDQVRTIKAWIDEGVDWPDALSGERAAPPVDPDAERLASLIRMGEAQEIGRLLITRPLAAKGRARGGATPLMFASLYGDTSLVRRLIELGADVNASDVAGATALMWAAPDRARMAALLDAGADVNAISDDRRTALSITAGSVGSQASVRLLLEYGANPVPALPSDPSPLRAAVVAKNDAGFQLLLDYGADARSVPAAVLRTDCFECALAAHVEGAGPLPLVPPPDSGLRPVLPPAPKPLSVAVETVDGAAIKAAVERALPPLQRIGPAFIQKTGCVSCHHNSLVSMAVATARERGYAVDERIAATQRDMTTTYLESWRARTLQNKPIAGVQDSVSYVMFGLVNDRQPSDAATDAQAIWLLRRQAADGRWPLATLRPPIESNDVAVTALSLRVVDAYAPRSHRAAADASIARARGWLTTTRGRNTEERAFRVLGLVWSGVDTVSVGQAISDLTAAQQADGGWAQEADMQSDAYATGEALVALELGGGAASARDAIRRGVEYLVRTQLADGSWFVRSHSVPIQAYFESGYPHGADQWISAAASAWATTALAASGERQQIPAAATGRRELAR